MQRKNNIFVGYVTPNEFNGMKIPLTLQHKTINEYVSSLKGIYKLSQTELIIKDAFTTLFSIIELSKPKSNIVMSSLFMLPESNNYRQEILKKIGKKKINLHFVFEKFKLNYQNMDELELFLDLFKIIKINQFPFK